MRAVKQIRSALGLSCSLTAIHKTLKKMNYTYKKTLGASEQDRQDIKENRQQWKQKQRDCYWDSKKFVFLDESCARTNMTRLRGRSVKGQRVYDKAPDGHWYSNTMLSSIDSKGQTHCIVFDNALTANIFCIYLGEVLAPNLNEGDIVVMDNLRAHKAAAAKRLIEAVGAQVLFLPGYSPDVNPIEKMWSKVKEFLRAFKARTLPQLHYAIALALDSISSNDALAWFHSCAYTFNPDYALEIHELRLTY